MNEIQQRIYSQLVALVDAVLPECRPRREFIINWKSRDIDYAYTTWKNNFQLKNLQYIPTLEKMIEESKIHRVIPH